ncbi:MAG: hypothetical protein EA401_07995 [Planctomycetota bacterium]|nr:MAG: hypothetical protein EA401_07995 [Planctomycetota bacterium]
MAAYAIMSNHLHLVVHADPGRAKQWDASTIATAWLRIRSNADPDDPHAPMPDPAHVQRLCENPEFIAQWRERLGSVSWFMKSLKEPLSRMANAEDNCRGAFWEGRFTSVPLLDEAALITCMAYVDLNPIRAKAAESLQGSAFTSIAARIRDVQEISQDQDLPAKSHLDEDVLALRPFKELSTPSADEFKESTGVASLPFTSDASWLLPIEEATAMHESARGWSLSQYLTLVDATGRCVRGDKHGVIDSRLPDIVRQLSPEFDPETWLETVATHGGLRGTALGHWKAVAEEAARRGLQWIQSRCRLFRKSKTLAAQS